MGDKMPSRSGAVQGAVVALVAATALIGMCAPAVAQVCGDADGDRRVTVTDGVQSLRAAAGLASDCTAIVCDVDGNGSVTLTDGVNILRDAAGLSAALGCGAGITGVFSMVERSSGIVGAVLDIGLAPVPGITATLGEPAGRSIVEAGRAVTYSIAYQVDSAVTSPSLLITVRDAETNMLVDGFYELALPGSSGVAEFKLRTTDRRTDVVVEFFTRAAGEVSAANGIDLSLTQIFFCCPIPMCVEGGNEGAGCASDGECPGGFCTDLVGCVGGANADRPCNFNSECPDGLCCPEGPCPPE